MKRLLAAVFALALGFVTCAPLAHATIAFVQEKEANMASGTGMAATFTSNVTVSNAIVVCVGTGSNTRVVNSIADTQGDTFVQLVANPISSRNVEIWYAKNTIAGADTVTATISSTGAAAIMIAEFSGLQTTGTISDQIATNNGASTTISTGTTPTLTQADELAIACTTKSTTTAPSAGPTNSFTGFTNVTTNIGLSSAWFINTSGTTGLSTGWTISSTTWIAAIGTLLGGGGGGGATPTPQFGFMVQ